jgi:signal transduction histidine kinase
MMLTGHGMPPIPGLPLHGTLGEFSAEGKQVRTLTRAFQVNDHWIEVESGITLTKTDHTLVLFRDELLLISPLIFLMAGLAGHLLSRRALDPVAAIAHEAQRIHDGNLQTRLPKMETRDELAHLSDTLNEMLHRIESGVHSVRDFTAYASHELRTPVALIRTEADLALQFERSNAEYQEAIEVIGSEAQRMSSLLDSLLFLARADAGAEQVQLEPIDARRLCIQAFEKWRPLLERVQLRLLADLPASAVQVMADPPYLQRLLTIILENAGKYTAAGGSVRLSLQVLGDSARFEVSDTGIGIPDKDKSRIFERFCRGGNVQEANAHGSGLGLALAAWIAARHQTVIEVDSILGLGSRFFWTLPLAAHNDADPGSTNAPAINEYAPLASAHT